MLVLTGGEAARVGAGAALDVAAGPAAGRAPVTPFVARRDDELSERFRPSVMESG
jgi:hypothetical protein